MSNIDFLLNHNMLNKIVSDYPVEDLAKSSTFKKLMVLSKKLLENEDFDFTIQEYAVHLIEQIKQTHPQEWDKNWKHEAYLGYAYSLVGYDIEKEFDAYSTAAKKAIHPPLEILMHMALLWNYPGVYKLKMDETKAIEILEEMANKTPYMEAVGGLIRLYEETKQVEKSAAWKKILKKSEEMNLHDRYSYLDFFHNYAE